MRSLEITSTARHRLNERHPDRLEVLRQWRDDPDVYISFVEVLKIGINPRSPWGTPVGVYAYPLREIYPVLETNRIPYAAQAPYIQVIRSDQATELATYSESDLQRDTDVLRDKYIDQLCDGGLWDNRRVYPQTSRTDAINRQYAEIKSAAAKIDSYDGAFDHAMSAWSEEAFLPHPASKMWNITRNMAYIMTAHRTMTTKTVLAQPGSIVWNTILRTLGYRAFSDKSGLGIIHENEPTSAVFLTGTAFRHLKTVQNVSKRKWA